MSDLGLIYYIGLFRYIQKL